METEQTAATITRRKGRAEELDFLKCVLILLMIAFHLVYIGDTYPYAKQIVYTFHMPAFLIVSGYLMKTERPFRSFGRTLLFFLIPYALMEGGYIACASILPIREHIDSLTTSVFLTHLLLHPLGPYWYLHTLVLCGASLYVVSRYVRAKLLTQLILLALLFAAYALLFGIVSLPMSLYFLAGAALRRSGLPFTRVFQPSVLAVAAMALLAAFPDNLQSPSVGSAMIVYLSICTCLYAYQLSRGRIRSAALFLGRNTLVLFLFSPIFTILCKAFQPYLLFEPTGMLFLAVSLVFCVAGSLVLGWIADRTGASRLFFGRKHVLS